MCTQLLWEDGEKGEGGGGERGGEGGGGKGWEGGREEGGGGRWGNGGRGWTVHLTQVYTHSIYYECTM